MFFVPAKNPSPGVLPDLSVWQGSDETGRIFTYVAAAFPDVPGFVCDSWLYEGSSEFLRATALADGVLECRHAQENGEVITTITPEPKGVEFAARFVAKTSVNVVSLVPLNLCWQFRRAPTFASKPDLYPEFAKRCFIFTEQGRTFLGEADRAPNPGYSVDHPYNRPPWVQSYDSAAGETSPAVGAAQAPHTTRFLLSARYPETIAI